MTIVSLDPEGGSYRAASPPGYSVKMPKASPESAQRLEELLPAHPHVRVRKMFGHPAAFANGNLCVGTFGRQLFVRLAEADAAVLSKVPGVRAFEPMPGRPMKQYFVLPPALLDTPAVARKWVARSIDYTLSLPPK
jgi:TfoX/Sxy family transcriptional regulator of competence genes